MLISGRQVHRAMADRRSSSVSGSCRRLGWPVDADDVERIERATEPVILDEWQATILAAVLGVGLSHLEISAPAKIDQLSEDLWWVKAQLYRLVESLRGANMVLPLDAGPELEHYYLHTPDRPRAGCKACVENFGGPEL